MVLEVSNQPTEEDIPRLNRALSALTGERRLRLLMLLREKELACRDTETCDLSERCCDVGELARALDLSMATVSHHLRELRLAGLVRTERQGKHAYSQIDRDTAEFLAAFFARIANT